MRRPKSSVVQTWWLRFAQRLLRAIMCNTTEPAAFVLSELPVVRRVEALVIGRLVYEGQNSASDPE